MANAAPFATGATGVQAVTGPCRLMGYSIGESAVVGAVATVILRDGTSASGNILAVLELVADSFDWAWFGPNGIAAHAGIFVDRSLGFSQGAIYYT